ncbi:MAG: SUF system Fe-S cluster assembly regulator [Pontixanthobacter sp.]
MRLSNLADYAVVTMTAAARHCGGGRVSASELAAETHLPAPTVQKVVSKLTAAGLLRSVRGAKGGLQLARPAAAITLADIVEAIEGPIALTACVDTGAHDCGLELNCAVRPHWAVVNRAVRGALADIPLTQLTQNAAIQNTHQRELA